MNVISIVIVEDHPLFREGLKVILQKDERFQITGEAGSGQEGLRLIKKLRPDIAIVDISLPDISGIKIIRDVYNELPGTEMLIVSMHTKIEYISEAFRAGAKGYVVKESAADRLIQGLETVSRGKYYIDSAVSNEVASNLMRGKETIPVFRDDYQRLTPREQEIMRLMVEGMSAKAIAEKLFISPKTVENHRANIMRKLEIHNSMELIRYAARTGLIDLNMWME